MSGLGGSSPQRGRKGGNQVRREGSESVGIPSPAPAKGRGGLPIVAFPFVFTGVIRGMLTRILTPKGGIVDFDSENPQGSTPGRTRTLFFDPSPMLFIP